MPLIETTALAAIFAWVWDQYGREITNKAGKTIWERLRWEDRALRYAQKVQRLYGQMQILGQTRPVQLEDVYTAINLLDKPTAWQRYSIEEMQAEFTGRSSRYFQNWLDDKAHRRDGLDIVRSGQNLFILGKPGAGKTTFLKHVALHGVTGEFGRVPIFISLNRLADSKLDVFRFVVGEFDVCDFPDARRYLEQLLKSGKVLLLFDGLDEVNVTGRVRSKLIAGIENFTRKYDQCQRLITCRLAANDYTFQGYTYVEMADFNEAQIREFVGKWFAGSTQQREKRALFLSELEKPESKGLRELARVPLLLALLCLAFEDTLRLSQRRVELYEEALNVLLKKWDVGRNIRRDEIYRELSLKRKKQMLSQVAVETFNRSEYFIPRRTLADGFERYLSRIPDVSVSIDGEVVIDAIIAQHGLFLEQAHHIYTFAHLTFQEYFTANYVVENEARGTLGRLVPNFADSRFREAFVMVAARLPNADQFFDLYLKTLAREAFKRPVVATLLRQAARKAATATGPEVKPAAVRTFYLYLALYFDRALTLGHALIDIDRTSARFRDRYIRSGNIRLAAQFDPDGEFASLNFKSDLSKALDTDCDLSRAQDPDRTLARVLLPARAFAFDIALNLDLPLDLANALLSSEKISSDIHQDLKISRRNSSMHRDMCIVQGWYLGTVYSRIGRSDTKMRRDIQEWIGAYLQTGVSQSRLLGNTDLQRRLEEFAKQVVHSDVLSSPRGQRIVEELRVIIEEDCGLKHLELVGEDWELISRYLRGNQLLLECLNQAAVSDRAAIEDRMLLMSPEAGSVDY
jgi:hypothetical protein